MRMNSRMAGVVLLALTLMSTPLFAADQEPFFRSCEKSDTTGVWRLENIDEKPIGDETLRFKEMMPYQYMFFDTDGRYYIAHANMEYGSEASVKALTKLATADTGLYYNSETKGKLVIRDAKRVTNQYSCNIALKSSYPYTKGGLILGEAIQKPVPTTIMRIYRRLYTAANSKKK